MGVISSLAFVWNANYDFVYEYRRSLIGCLILATVYMLLGIALMIVCLKSRERIMVQVLSVIVSVLLLPTTILSSKAMCAITLRPVSYDSYKEFSSWEEVYIAEAEIPANATDCKYLKADDGHINAVSFKIDTADCEKYENENHETAIRDYSYGTPIEECFTIPGQDYISLISPLIGDDDINDYVVLESNLGNQWYEEWFVNRKTGRYIFMVTHNT